MTIQKFKMAAMVGMFPTLVACAADPGSQDSPATTQSFEQASSVHLKGGARAEPSFRDDGVFRYPDTVREITLVNAQLRKLAPVLNAPALSNRVTVAAGADIATLVKHVDGATYVFAINMQKRRTPARLALAAASGTQAIVIGEDRTIAIDAGALSDDFDEYGVHLYRIPDAG